MKTISREGYSKSFRFDDPDYFEENEEFQEIGDGVYSIDIRDESAVIVYNEERETVDVVGDFNAVRGVQWNYRQDFGADAGFNNGVGEHYEPERAFRSEDAVKALQEFGVAAEGLETDEREKPVAASD